MNYAKISLVLGISLSLILTGCYKNDPLKEKERELEALKNKTEQPKPKQEEPKPNDNQGSQPQEDPKDNPNPGNNSDDKPKEDPKQEEPQKEEFVETTYSFELWGQVGKEPYSVPLLSANEDPTKSYWVSASNSGYKMALLGGQAKFYPSEALDQGYKGKGVHLRSIETFLAFVAGSLYTGVIDNKNIFNPARFGQPCTEEPVEISFYYQYKAGSDRVAGLEGQRDHGSVQGVLYEVTNKQDYLDKASIKNDERIVSRAYTLLSDTQAGEWTKKTIKFEPVNTEAAKSIDFKTKKYRLSLILSSSARGDELKGADGSELLIDELTLKSKTRK